MSVSKETTVWCEGEKCVEWVQLNTGSTADARAAVKRAGWKHRGGKDLCPRCAR